MGSPAHRESALVASHTTGESSLAPRQRMQDLSISDKSEEHDITENASEEEGEEAEEAEEEESYERGYDEDDDLEPAEQDATNYEMDLKKEMQREKSLYPGAKTWAAEEEKLFELLFMRQSLPILPAHWEVDFRNVPIGIDNFSLDDETPPLIYAHGKEFLGKLSCISSFC